MSYASFRGTDRFVSGDGNYTIFTCDADGSNRVDFPYHGCDPAWAWNGAAIIFLSLDRQQIWCANVDGSGLYNLGVIAGGGGGILVQPTLNLATGWYWVNHFDPSSNTYQLYKFHNGGYDITLMANLLEWGYDVQPNGLAFVCSGWCSGHWQLLYGWADQTHYGWLNGRTDSGAQDYPDARRPAFSHTEFGGPGQYILAYSTGDLVAVDPHIPASYRKNGIARWCPWVSVTPWHVVDVAPGMGIYVDSPAFSSDDSTVTYDFNDPNGSGVWATDGFSGGGVQGNANGCIYQMNSGGCTRCKHK
jgi:hypothetical protein